MGIKTGNRRNPHADYRTPPEDMVAWAVRSLDDLPAEMRAAKLSLLADAYREMFEASKLPCPEWIGMLAALAEEQAAAIPARREPEGNEVTSGDPVQL